MSDALSEIAGHQRATIEKPKADADCSPAYCSADLIQAVLNCATEELQARLSGMENGFDHPNALVLFGRAKGIAIALSQQKGKELPPADCLMVDPMSSSIKWAIMRSGKRVSFGEELSIEGVRQVQKSSNLEEVWIDRGFRTREVDAACVLFGWTGIKGRAGERGPWNEIEEACDF